MKMRTKQHTSTIFNMNEISNDSSENKVISHRRLQSECLKNPSYLEEYRTYENDVYVNDVYKDWDNCQDRQLCISWLLRRVFLCWWQILQIFSNYKVLIATPLHVNFFFLFIYSFTSHSRIYMEASPSPMKGWKI
jgi:hypothetical protein